MNAVDVREMVWVESVDTAQAVIEFGNQHGMTFKVLDRRDLLQQTERDEKYVYYPIDELPQGFHIPNEAHRRLEMVGSNFPIQQIIIADDLTKPATFGEVAKKVARVGMSIMAIATVLVFEAMLTDPKLIIVVDGQWISIAEWL
jgi:hypothetical protein